MASLLRRGRRASQVTMSSRISPGRALVAAADPIDLGDEKARNRARRLGESWQARAWEFADELGEAGYASRYFGNGMSRLNLYVGIRTDPNDDPAPLDPKGDTEAGYSEEEATAALDALERLESPEGGKPEMLRRLAVNMFVPGECYLCGRHDDDLPGERWDVYSTEELRPARENIDRWELARSPESGSSDATELPDDTLVSRIWRPHPRISTWPDSPMRSALGICDELLTLRKSIKGSALSRLASSGWLPLPNSMRRRPPGAEPGEDAGKTGQVDEVVQDFMAIAAAGIADPASAAARVPLVTWVNDDVYEKLDPNKFYRWDQEIDATAAAQREELTRAFANAIDLPPEIVTGKAGLNEWGAWVVTEDTWKAHLEPTAILLVMALTAAYLRPYLSEAAIEDPQRFVIWYDPAQLLTRPSRSEESRWAYEQILITSDKAREDLGYSEEDKPEPEEIELRLLIDQVRRGRIGDQLIENNGPGEVAIPTQGPRALPGTETGPDNGPEPVAGAAAPIGEEIRGLAEQLGAIELALFSDLHVSLDAHLRGVLEHVNSRLKAYASKEQPLRAAVKDLTGRSLQVAPALGPAVVQRLAEGRDLLADLAAYRPLWDTRIHRVDDELVGLAAEHGDLLDAEALEWGERLASDREASWQALLAALTGLTEELLFRPVTGAAPPPDEGEDRGLLVPPLIVRDSLIVAGGGAGGEDDEATGMVSGHRVGLMFGAAGILLEGRKWLYGDPSMRKHGPFPPHLRLDFYRTGRIYSGPRDERLRNYSGFPGRSHFSPRDHKGCLCQLVPAKALRRAGTVEVVPALKGVGV